MPWEFFDRSATEVETNISIMNQRADEAMAEALGAVDALKDIKFDFTTDNVPQFTLPDINIPDAVDPSGPEARIFGTIAGGTTNWEDLTSKFGITDFTDAVPTFNPTVGLPDIGNAPEPFSGTAPERPTLSQVAIPPAPGFTLPDVGDLIAIEIPDFTFPELPTFTDTAPTFTEAAPHGGLVWVEPEYTSAELDEVQAEVHRMMQGGTGLPTAVQDALFQAARSREDVTALAAQQEAFDTFAGRGFAMPPGMLAKAVEAATEKSRLAANALERELLTKAATWEIENLRFAVERGIALQTILIGSFQQMAQRTFEAAKFRFDADMKLYELAITLFNAKQGAYTVAATVFKARIEGEMAKVQMFKAAVEAEVAKGTLNEQTVKVFVARLEGVQKLIEVYKTQMQAAEIESKLNESLIAAYKVDVDAFGSQIAAKKAEYDGYDSHVKGELSKAQVYDSQARAFGELVRAYDSKATIKGRFVDAKIAAIRVSNEKFAALSEEQRNLVQAQLAAVQGAVSAFNAEVGRYTAEIQGSNQTRGVELQVAEARTRNLLAYYEIRVREYDQAQERLLKRVTILEEALKAAGQVSGALATGAMSAIHMSAAMHGNATVSDTQSYNVNINRQGADAA